MKFNYFVLLVITTLVAITTKAQQPTAVLSGQVTSAAGHPLADAAVALKGTNNGAYTNATGKFIIEKVKPGKYTLVVTMMGYTKQERSVTIAAGTKATENFQMVEESVTKEGVTVISKSQNRQVKESGFAVNAIETRLLANTTTDMNQLLNRTTGVKVREQGGMGSDFNFSINGLSGKAVRFFIDGVPMEVMGSAMSLNNIPVNLAERVEVYKGVLPVTLGADALGGAVNLVTNQQIKNYLDASYSVGSFNSHRGAITGQITGKKTGIIARVSGFVNYSDNDYTMKRMKVYDSTEKTYVRRDVRRFHDQYRSAMVQAEAGIANKKWADVLFIGAGLSNTGRDIQSGTDQERVYGAAVQSGSAWNTTLRYKKNNLFTEGLDLNVFASHTADKSKITDTTEVQYSWDGSYRPYDQAELNQIKSINHISRPRNYARVNLSYKLSAAHSFNLNYTFDQVTNNTYNELLADKDDNPAKLGKNLVGLAYRQDLVDGRLQNTFFGKYYGLNLRQPRSVAGSGEITSAADNQHYFGYGVATRYMVLPALGVKASYEKAYRLQEVGEMFGNGIDQTGNPDLRPENSNNFNLGAFYNLKVGQHRIYGEAGAFYRDAVDFIYARAYQSNSKVSRFENTSKVQVKGFEAEVQYEYGDIFRASANASYQSAINNTKYASGSKTGTPEATYKNKIPNQPWFFGNAAASIGQNNLFTKKDRLQLGWDFQYVHWFFLTWEEFAAASTKSKVPTQYIQHLAVTYSLQDGRYNISAECRNFTDQRVYDNFSLQKPGRAFYVKLRYFIH
ncbi:Outer membrane receptor proteins, mostly Fe transport [Chitinophaga jiangningensis]|uniref:Outer membrane receptor proteins, mostly Fe transport n=1 Tax=Chitinophaga jiangningensis TaxID=1419482 RepID=A0A1M6Y5L0_9BACT|nr:TonB-dependent receptor [Chitinophaga jiangningensis]SHL13482.1 Outer membrane receptor proteins, mostly Fe transport [Chitinophaga jiangningensis]